MGYVSLKNTNQFIPPGFIQKSSGVWTPAVSGDLVSEARQIGAGAFYLLIPITLTGSNLPLQGSKLKSVDIHFKISTAVMTAMASVTVKKIFLPENGVVVGSADYPAITLDAGHDTEAERKAIATHKMTVTFTERPYIGSDEGLFIVLSCEAAATSDFTLYGAQANFELRI